MSQLNVIAGIVLQSEFDIDDDGYVTSAKPFLPPTKELIIGSAASLIVFALLYKFAWPTISKGMKDRTARIQKELDDSAAARAKAEQDAADIRAALGDIDAERQRLFAEAETQAAAILEDGRRRLDEEVAQLEAKANDDIASAADRGADDLRADIARYSSEAIESSVRAQLDDATQQQLIEDFIARVGAGTGAGQ